jgi:hypothetical protein
MNVDKWTEERLAEALRRLRAGLGFEASDELRMGAWQAIGQLEEIFKLAPPRAEEATK